MAETKWTKDAPTKKGHYWMKTREDFKPDVVYIYGREIFYSGNDCGEPISDYPNAKWFGPLVAPEEPTAAPVAAPSQDGT